MNNWVKKHLVPLNACLSAIEKAEQYRTPQKAWEAWEIGGELLWILGRTNADKRNIILCACDIAERVLPWFEEVYPNDKRPRRAIEAARRCAKDNSCENIAVVVDAISAADAAANASRSARASHCARAAAYAARTTVHIADAAAVTALKAAYAARSENNAAYVVEQKAQAEIVRKYFPVSPSIKKRRNEKAYDNGMEEPQAKAERLREIYDEKVRQLKESDTSIDEASRRNLLDRYKRFFEAKEAAIMELAKLGSQRNAPRKAKSKISQEIESLQIQIEEVEILIEKKEQIFQEFVKAKIDLLQHKVAM